VQTNPGQGISITIVTSAELTSPCPEGDDDDADWNGRDKDHGHGPPAFPPGQAKKR
jgi:hypothetical protein